MTTIIIILVLITPVQSVGIPMAKAAAGVACGLAVKINPETGEIDKYQILTDIAVRVISRTLN